MFPASLCCMHAWCSVLRVEVKLVGGWLWLAWRELGWHYVRIKVMCYCQFGTYLMTTRENSSVFVGVIWWQHGAVSQKSKSLGYRFNTDTVSGEYEWFYSECGLHSKTNTGSTAVSLLVCKCYHPAKNAKGRLVHSVWWTGYQSCF